MESRSFIALDLPSDVQAELQRIQNIAEKAQPNIYKWTPPENLHLTLYFLGEVSQDDMESIKNRVTINQSFQLELGKILVFPEPTVPKILGVELAGDIKVLKSLQQRVHDSVFQIATHRETRPFVAHITLGRLKREVPPSAKPVKKLIAAIPTPKPVPWTANEIWMYESKMSPTGPIYEKTHCFSCQS